MNLSTAQRRRQIAHDAATTEIYIVIDHEGVVRERSAGEQNAAATARDIWAGEFGDIARVLCLCPSEGTCRDVTEDIARMILDQATEPLTGAALDLVENEIGIRAARDAGT